MHVTCKFQLSQLPVCLLLMKSINKVREICSLLGQLNTTTRSATLAKSNRYLI